MWQSDQGLKLDVLGEKRLLYRTGIEGGLENGVSHAKNREESILVRESRTCKVMRLWYDCMSKKEEEGQYSQRAARKAENGSFIQIAVHVDHDEQPGFLCFK